VTPHFTLEELIFSNTAVRLDIDNTPDEEALKNLQILAEGLEHVRTKLNGNAIRISSGYRCLPLNRALRSKDTSFQSRYGIRS
jgi:zinc D-Ala-D-Ala carboxypeptidase